MRFHFFTLCAVVSLVLPFSFVNLASAADYVDVNPPTWLDYFTCENNVKSNALQLLYVPGYIRMPTQTWRGPIAEPIIDNNHEVHLIAPTSSYWSHGVQKIPNQQDLLFSVCVKISDSSSKTTSFKISMDDLDKPANKIVENDLNANPVTFMYDGWEHAWVIYFGDQGYLVADTPEIPKDRWVQLTLEKTGEWWHFYVDGQQIRTFQNKFLSQINTIDLSSGNLYGGGGADVSWKNPTISDESHVDLDGKSNPHDVLSKKSVVENKPILIFILTLPYLGYYIIWQKLIIPQTRTTKKSLWMKIEELIGQFCKIQKPVLIC